MALRSLNAGAPERRKNMRRARMPPLVGANDENVDLRWSPNLPSRNSCKPSPSPVCSETPAGKPSPFARCGEVPALLSSPSPACSEASVPLSCKAVRLSCKASLPPRACCEGSALHSCKPSQLPVYSEVFCCSEASAPLPSLAEPSRSPACSEASSAEVEYILSEHLPNPADVDSIVSTLLEKLDSKDWLKVCEALNNMRQLSIYHKSSLLQLLDKAVPLLVKAMKNPRSALCKTAIMASADLFSAFPEEILVLLEQLLLQLLLKASQDKRFVCEEAERSLEVMTACLPPASLLAGLQPYAMHRNPRVRAKAASCVYRSVSKLGSEGIQVFGFQPLLQIAASQLNDQLPEARESARKLVGEVYAAYPGPVASESADSVSDQQDWHQFCNAHLSSHFAQAILRLTSGS